MNRTYTEMVDLAQAAMGGPATPATPTTATEVRMRRDARHNALNAMYRVMMDNAAMTLNTGALAREYLTGAGLDANTVLTDPHAATMAGMAGAITNSQAAYEVQKLIEEEAGAFCGTLVCKTTQIATQLRSPEREALTRGIDVLSDLWMGALQNLARAGLLRDELAAPMALIQPRVVRQAQRIIESNEKVIAAGRKAKALLVMCLNASQREDFEKRERFAIEVQHKLEGFPVGQFQIAKAASFNVTHVESGERFCVTAEGVPVYDQMLTQKLLLEQDPERFFKTANRDGSALYLGAPITRALNEVMEYYIGADHANNAGDTIRFRRWTPPFTTGTVTATADDPLGQRPNTRREAVVEARFPDWQDTVRSPEFGRWFNAQPRNIQQWAESQDPRDAIRMLEMYANRPRNRGNTLRVQRPERHYNLGGM